MLYNIHVPVVEDVLIFFCKCAENCTEDKACLLAADVMENETDDDANYKDATRTQVMTKLSKTTTFCMS
jgi:hypothetical protein